MIHKTYIIHILNKNENYVISIQPTNKYNISTSQYWYTKLIQSKTKTTPT